MPRMAMGLEFLECGGLNRNGLGIFGARCLTWNFSSTVPRLNFWSAVLRIGMDLESLERGA